MRPTVSLPPISSEVKSRGVRFPDSTPLPASPESYEAPLPSEANSRVLDLSTLLDRAPMIDPRLQMIKRRSQCETKLSPLYSFRKTMGVPFPESGPFEPTNFTPDQTPYPVSRHPLDSESSLFTTNSR